MDKIKPLFTATATATGGRNGHTGSSNSVIGADLSVPKEMGGSGKPGTATPEHLFAAGLRGLLRGRPRPRRETAQAGCEQSQGDMCRIHRPPRRRRLWAGRKDAYRGQEPAASRSGELSSRSSRKDLSLFACNARQCRRRLRRHRELANKIGGPFYLTSRDRSS